MDSDKSQLRETTHLSSEGNMAAQQAKLAEVTLSKGGKPKGKLRRKIARMIGENTPLMKTQYKIINEDDLRRYKLPRKMLGKQVSAKVKFIKVNKVRIHLL